MRARVSSRRNRKGFGEGLWQSLLGNNKSAARLRKWSFLITSLLILGIILRNAPANEATFLPWIFSARFFGHLLAIFLSISIGIQGAALAQAAIYSINNVKDSKKHVLGNAFSLSKSQVDLHPEKESSMKTDERIDKIGGPSKLHIQMDTAALLETSWGSLYCVGPSKNEIELESFERVRQLLDLRDQVIDLNIWGRTKDGIRVSIEGARIVYSIARGNREANLAAPYPFSMAAAMRIGRLFENEINNSSSGNGADPNSPIGLHGANFFKRELQSFIGSFWLGELLAAPSRKSLEESGKENNLFLARESIRKQFIEQSRANAMEQGLQIHWIDIGTWKVDKLAQSILQEYQEENLIEHEFLGKDFFESNKNAELARLFGELVRSSMTVDRDRGDEYSSKRIINSYFGLIDGLRLRYENLLGEDNAQLSLLMRFLKVLDKNSKGKMSDGDDTQ